ncbi:thioredoxin [candidate division KSB1 bacterium]|nr:thioredoxin [candidate division KSB1 bacterium]
MANLANVTEKNFNDEVLTSELPVLVDFWAIWCGPCKVITPIVEELAQEYQGKLKVMSCDVDTNQSIAINYGIRSIPTLLIFKQGQVVQQIIGALPKPTIKSKIDAVLD